MKQPWLSVIIPTYNGERYLNHALESMVTQGDRDIETIVVDDGSSDKTINIVKKYDPQLRIQLHVRPVKNWVKNTNFGLEQATGKFACFLHQDDFWLPNRLRTIKKQLTVTPDISLLMHSCNFVDPNSRTIGRWTCPLPDQRILASDLVVEKFLVHDIVAIPGTIFSRESALKVGGLDETLWYTADWDFWIKMAKQGNTVCIGKPLAAFRIHPQSQTAVRSQFLEDFRRQMDAIRERHEPDWNPRFKRDRHDVIRVSRASVELNVLLAAAYHGQAIDWRRVLPLFAQLRPADWQRLLHNSRLRERVIARLRAGFPFHKQLFTQLYKRLNICS